MALNLWSTGGQPTSFNPLTTGYTAMVHPPLSVNCTLTFTASSASHGRIGLEMSKTTTNNTQWTLTATPTQYTATVNVPVADNLYLRDQTNSNDIVVTNIQFVQAPLPKLTINGIDGFNSGKWSLFPTSVVIDDQNLSMTFTNTFQSSSLDIPFTGTGLVTLSVKNPVPWLSLRAVDVNNTDIARQDTPANATSVTLNVPSGTQKLRVWLGNAGVVTTGTYTFSQPVLNLGSTPAVYQAKIGDRMVMPTFGKNLLGNTNDITQWQVQNGATITDTGMTYMNQKVFRVVFPTGSSLARAFLNINSTGIFSGSIFIKQEIMSSTNPAFYFRQQNFGTVYGTTSFPTTVDGSWQRIAINNANCAANFMFLLYQTSSSSAMAQFLITAPQLEQGATTTFYQPYSVGINPPVKNRNLTQPTQEYMTNFVGKKVGDFSVNANKGYRGSMTSLQTPTSAMGLAELQNVYDGVAVLSDGNVVTSGGNASVNGSMGQMMFSFDTIALITKQYGAQIWQGATDIASKVAIAKSIISNINLNWYGYGSNITPNPTYTTDFAGKVSGSTVANANIAKSNIGDTNTMWSTLQAPSQFANEFVGGYSSIASQDGTSVAISESTSGNMAQTLFSFNLIEYIKRKYGYTPDVTWLKANLSSVSLKWSGYGSSPSGNNASIAPWTTSGSGSWGGAISTTSSSVYQLTYGISGAGLSGVVDSNGFINFIAYANASDGVTASTINTDYVSLDVTLNGGGNKATMQFWQGSSWDAGIVRTNTSNTPTLLNINKAASTGVINTYLQPDGFMYAIAYANAANGISASNLNTDYVELLVDVTLPKTNLPRLGSTGGMVFDGNSNIALPTNFFPLGANTISAEAWISGDYSKSIFGHGAYSGGNMFNLTVNNTFPAIDNGGGGVTSGQAITPNTMNHVAATYDGTTVTLYLNGVSVGSYPRVLNMGDSNNYIGNGYYGQGTGTIYKVAVYDRYVSAAEIANNFAQGSPTGASLATYDFTDPRTVYGTSILTVGSQNLVPSFDDPRWSAATTYQITGKDYVQLTTGSTFNEMHCIINVQPNTYYVADLGQYNLNQRLYVKSADGTTSLGASINSGLVINTGSNTQVLLAMTNAATGSYTWMRPTFFKNGGQGWINGTPKPFFTPARRNLYAKR